MHPFFSALGLRYPLIQAPMAGVQDAPLAIAVAQAGGLGSIPCAMHTPETLQASLQKLTHALGPQSVWNVNFFAHREPAITAVMAQKWQQQLQPLYEAHGLTQDIPALQAGRQPFSAAMAEVLAPFRPRVVSFHFGLPQPDLLEQVKSWGSQVIASATTVAEAQWLQAHGADAIIAQGLEAGGHRGHFLSTDLSLQMGTFALLPQIVDAVSLPVIAAGGISSPREVVAAFALGAAGVQVGTAYLLSHEATTSTLHRQALQSAHAQHTAITRVFTGGAARGILNEAMQTLGRDESSIPAFPLATSGIAPLRAKAESEGSSAFTPLWSGQNNHRLQAVAAADITHALGHAALSALHPALS